MHKGKQVGMGLDGGLAEYVVAPANAVVPIGQMDPADAAPLTDAGLSSYHAVKRVLPLLQGGWHWQQNLAQMNAAHRKKRITNP